MIRDTKTTRTLNTTLMTLLMAAPSTALALMNGGPGGSPGGLMMHLDGPVVEVADDCLELGSLYVCGDWQADGGEWTLDGDARIPTLAGDIHLGEATLTASIDPPALDGEARLAFPSLGFLEHAGFDDNAPWGRIALGDGDVIDSIEINGWDMPAEEGHQYLIVDYDQGFGMGFGAFSMSGGGDAATIVIDASDPLIYVGGDVGGFLGDGQITDAAMGFSLGGRLPFITDLELCEKSGEDCARQSVRGHVLGSGRVKIGKYPVWVDADLIIDADADRDGDTIFDPDEDLTDMRIGVNGAIEIGYAVGPVDLTIPVAEGSLVYDGSRGEYGRLQMRGIAGAEGLFDGTPFEMLQPDTPEVDFKGWFKSPTNFSMRMDYAGPMFGLETEDVQLELTNSGLKASGTLRPGLGELFGDSAVGFSGSIRTNGSFSFRGTATLAIAGFEMADAVCTWTNSGISFVGIMDLPALGNIAVSGSIDNAGHVTFNGDATIEILGFELANATIALDGGALAVSGDLGLPGLGSVTVSGDIHSDGDFSLTGSGALEPLGFQLAQVEVGFAPGGVEVEGRVNLAGLAQGRISGAVWSAETSMLPGGGYYQCELFRAIVATMDHIVAPPCAPPSAGFRLRGDMRVGWQGVSMAGATVTVSNDGARIKGDFNFAGVQFRVRGGVTSSGRVDLTSTASVNWGGTVLGSGAKLSGEIELDMGINNSGPYVDASFDLKACGKVWPIEVCENMGGSISSNGKVCVDFPLIGNQCLDLSGIL